MVISGDAELYPQRIQTRAEFAAGLTALRERAGLTVRLLAQRVDSPSATVGGYLSGRHVPSPAQQELVVRILAACGVTADDEVEAWLAALRRARTASDRRTTRTSAPYRGLASFEPEDAALFFGRDRETGQVLARLQAAAAGTGPRLIAVVGPSGSGKSSLLRAGVVAAVRGGALSTADGRADGTADGADVRWECQLMTPGRDPVTTLACLRATAPGPGPVRTVLVVDQFEELFTSVAADERARFLDLLVGPHPDPATAPGTAGPAVTLLGLRADFYGEAAREPRLLDALRDGQLLLGPLAAADIRTVVVGPAQHLGIAVDDALIDVLLADLTPHDTASDTHDAGALPLLSHALLTAWEHSSGRQLTVADYRSTGGLDAAVQRTAEAVYAELSPAQRDLARNLFLRLVNVDGEIAVTRRRVDRAELEVDRSATGVALHDVVDHFVDRRLLTATATSVEISHEALLTAWPRLRSWLDAGRADVQLHRRVTTATNVWVDAGHDPTLLADGARLESALEWASEPAHQARLNPAEREFLAASAARRDQRRRTERQRNRRLRQLLAVALVLAVVAIGLAGWARHAQRQADRERTAAGSARDAALASSVAFQSRRLASEDPALAQQLALAAFRIDPTAAARAAVTDAAAAPVVSRLLGPLGPTPVAVTAAGSLAAIGHADGTVQLVALRSGRAPARVGLVPAGTGAGQVFALAFNRSATILAVGGSASTITAYRVGDVRRPQRLAVFRPHFHGDVQSMAFVGDTLMAGSVGPTPIERWRVDGATPPRELPPPAGVSAKVEVRTIAVTPDGRFVAAAARDAVRVWPASAMDRAPQVLTVADGSPQSVALTPDGRGLLIGTSGGEIEQWSLTGTPRRRAVLPSDTNAFVNTLSVSPDGTTVGAGYSDGTLRQWDLASRSTVSTTPGANPVTGVAYGLRGVSLLSASSDGTLCVASASGRAIPVSGTAFALSFDRDGTRLLVANNGDAGAVRIWDGDDLAGAVPLSPPMAMAAPATAVDGTGAIRGDGGLVAAGNGDGQVELWDTTDPAHPTVVHAPFTAAPALIENLNFDPTGNLLAVASDDGTVAVWDVRAPSAPRLVARLPGAALMLNAVFSRDGRLLAAVSSDGSVYLWQVSGSTPPRRVARLTGFRLYAYGVAFSADSTMLAASSSDRTARVWSIRDPSHPRLIDGPLVGPDGYALSVAFAPDGHSLAVGSADARVYVYDLGTRSRFPDETLTASGEVWAVSYAPSGGRLLAAGRAPSVTSWPTQSAEFAQRLCPLAGDPITRQEWGLYVQGAPYHPPCGAGN